MKRYISFILTIIISLSLCSCTSNNRQLNEDNIRAICELATYKCYYNNVAKLDIPKKYWPQRDRVLWMEYEGVATIGVDMSKLTVVMKKNKIVIGLPSAELLDVSPVLESMNEKSYIYSQDGFVVKNHITTKDQTEALVKGQQEMTDAVNGNNAIFIKAEKRAKELIEGFIRKMYGEKYKIEWKQIS